MAGIDIILRISLENTIVIDKAPYYMIHKNENSNLVS
jgi:hypothetical protein